MEMVVQPFTLWIIVSIDNNKPQNNLTGNIKQFYILIGVQDVVHHIAVSRVLIIHIDYSSIVCK